MAVGVAMAGLTIVSTGFSMKAKRDAEQAERERQIKAAWADYGATAFEFDKSREQAKTFHVEDMATARAKMGASGVRIGTEQWGYQMRKYEDKYVRELESIQAREDEWRKTESYGIARNTYEAATSVSAISREYGLPGDPQGIRTRNRKNIRFSYDDYKGDNPLVPGYQGKDKLDLTMGPVNRNTRSRQQATTGQAQYVSQAFYETARPTMDEYYWINYGGDEGRKAEAQQAIAQRREEFIATYGSPIYADVRRPINIKT